MKEIRAPTIGTTTSGRVITLPKDSGERVYISYLGEMEVAEVVDVYCMIEYLREMRKLENLGEKLFWVVTKIYFLIRNIYPETKSFTTEIERRGLQEKANRLEIGRQLVLEEFL